MPAAGVPARVAVPFPLSVKVTPVGRRRSRDGAGSEYPVVVTVKVPAVPDEGGAVARGDGRGPSTVRVKDWVASGAKPLEASMVKCRRRWSRPPGCRPGWPCRHRCR